MCILGDCTIAKAFSLAVSKTKTRFYVNAFLSSDRLYLATLAALLKGRQRWSVSPPLQTEMSQKLLDRLP